MNELQIGMIGLGAAVVGGVLTFNKWQERKQRQLAERVLDNAHTDVLLDSASASTPAPVATDDEDIPADYATSPAAELAPAAGAAHEPHFSAIDEEPLVVPEPILADPAPTPQVADAVAGLAPFVATDGRIEPHLGALDPLPGVLTDAPEAAAASADSQAASIEAPVAVPPVTPAPASVEVPPATVAERAPASIPVPPAAPNSPVAPLAPSAAELPRESLRETAARESAREAAREGSREGATAPRDTPPPVLFSPLIDYVALIEAADPSPAAPLLRMAREALARVRKPIRWLGCNEQTGEWDILRHSSPDETRERAGYRRLHIGLQLVDRRGPVSDAELAIFQRAIQDIADELLAVAELPPAQPALTTAAGLDAFCADVDIQVGLNVVSQGAPFAGSKLRALAEAAGMALDGAGRFVRRDDDGNALFSLSNQEASPFVVDSIKTLSTHGVTFLLDVPRVANGDRVFAQMVEQARRFAATLHGALVDDNRRPLADGALEPIRRTIAQSQAAMSARGIPAGSPLAQRLFA
ncbi:cell division protein ZipA C-terminal FtsZ-binding domain-containing protein [Rhodocyclus gracilis]|nr:cell division protein ZipA C-terminal FtsZ-binding domain-containing protein [Rhodocyclus gracilis]